MRYEFKNSKGLGGGSQGGRAAGSGSQGGRAADTQPRQSGPRAPQSTGATRAAAGTAKKPSRPGTQRGAAEKPRYRPAGSTQAPRPRASKQNASPAPRTAGSAGAQQDKRPRKGSRNTSPQPVSAPHTAAASRGASASRQSAPLRASAQGGPTGTGRTRAATAQQASQVRYRASNQQASRPRTATRRTPRPTIRRAPRRPISIPRSLIGVALVLTTAIAIYLHWDMTRPITVYANGVEVEITERTAQAAFEAAGSPAHAGDLYDIEGELLEEEAGGEVIVAVNGDIGNFDSKLSDGDELIFMNGDDAEEPSEILEDQEIEPEIIEQGSGPIYSVVQEPQAGVATVQHGTVSDKTIVLEVVQEAVDGIYQRWYPDTGDDKVIALTFDDGPTSAYTGEILDVLAEYGIKATFFTIGEQITGTGAELVLREYEEGHQVCTHTWDHAEGSGNGVNLSYMTEEEQREEIAKGLQAITDVIGVEASTVFRAPGGNFPIEVWRNLEDLISAQVIWTVDTEDWSRPGTSAIASAIKSAKSGDIVLMHDGGGNRSQTVEALKIAIPYLLSQGYTFVTIDELMEYPAKES